MQQCRMKLGRLEKIGEESDARGSITHMADFLMGFTARTTGLEGLWRLERD